MSNLAALIVDAFIWMLWIWLAVALASIGVFVAYLICEWWNGPNRLRDFRAKRYARAQTRVVHRLESLWDLPEAQPREWRAP